MIPSLRSSLIWILRLPIHFYRRWISPWKPRTCRFHPSCSQYALEALETHGPFKGLLLTAWRILRCQPFGKGGFDPVPPQGNPRSNVPEEKTTQKPEPLEESKHYCRKS